jgi:hypothetical protein
MTKKELAKLEQQEQDEANMSSIINNEKDTQEYYDNCTTVEKEIGACQPELIHKRMNDINTFQAHENEVYLRGTDEYGKDFQICFDAYNFLEWIDTEHLKYIKKQLIKYIKTK